MTADVPTLMLMVIVSSVVMAGALLVLGGWRRQDGLPYWAGALLLGGAGYALFLTRGRLPDMLSIVLANALLSSMFSGMIAAVQCFHGHPPRWLRLVVLPTMGPRRIGSGSPQRMAGAPLAPWPGCEVSRMWRTGGGLSMGTIRGSKGGKIR